MAQYYHTKDSAFVTRTVKRGEGYYVRGTYWRRSNELRDKVEVRSIMDSLGYKGSGYFGTKEETMLNVYPFRLHIEQLRKTCSTSGGGGGGGSSASHTKVYFAAMRNTMRSGGRDEVVAKVGFAACKRPLGTEQPEVNN